jgi:hypothetical protein
LRPRAAPNSGEHIRIVLTTQRVIDGPGVRRMAEDNRPVAFFNRAGGELPAKRAGQFPVQGEEQDAGCPAIQSVGRPDALPDRKHPANPY